MKTCHLKIVLCVAVILLLGVCTKDSDENIKPSAKPEMSISPNVTAIEFSSDGQTATVTGAPTGSGTPVGQVLTANGKAVFTMTTNQSSWDASTSGSNWVQVSKSDKTFTVTVNRNETASARTPAKITFSAGDASRFTVDVSQKARTGPPEFTLVSVSDVTATSAILNYEMKDVGAPPYTLTGVCWGTSQNPTTANSKKEVSAVTTGNFNLSANNLNEGTTYYARAYAITASGTTYSNELNFTTLSTGTVPEAPANLTANAVSTTQIDLSWNSVADAHGYKVERSLNENTGWQEIDGAVTGTSYQSNGLTAGTQYFYRVRAYNAKGNSEYSNIAGATTQQEYALPTVTTANATGITQTSAILGGNITNAGTPPYQSRGIFFSTSPNVNEHNSNQYSMSGMETTGNFSEECNVFTPNTTYYVRAFALNATGYALGNEVSFTTLSSGTEVPSAPTGLTATAVSTSQIDLSWNSVSGADGYRVERSTDSNNWSIIATSVTATTYQSIGLSVGTRYYFRVSAYIMSEYSDYSNMAEATTHIEQGTVPSAPTGLTATAVSTSQIDISWNSVSGATGYKVERSTNQTSGFTEIAGSVTGTSYPSTGLAAGTQYFYRVRAYNAVGDSDYSNVAGATTTQITLAIPSNLTATAASTTQINLNWNAVTDAAGYKVERSTSSSGTFTEIAGAVTGTTYQSTGLSAGTTYYYRVRAYTGTVHSNYSTTVNTITLPAAPANLTATAASTSQINLIWNAVTGAAGYKVERSTSSSGTFTEIAGAVAGTSYQSTGLSASTQYFYRVRAYNASGNSAYSATANATTQTAVSAPTLSGPSSASGAFSLTGTFNWPALGNSNQRWELEYSYNMSSGYSVVINTASGTNYSPYTFQLTTDANDAGKTVYFRVRVRLDIGEYSPYSAVHAVSVPAAPSPITVGFTRSNMVSSLYPNTSYPNTAIVGRVYMWNFAGYSLNDYATAVYFNVNSQISGKTIKKAELRMQPSVIGINNQSTMYNIEAISTTWTTTLTYNQTLSLGAWNGSLMTQRPPSSTSVPWVVDVTNYVRNWASGSWINHGILLYDLSTYPGQDAYRSTEFSNIVLYVEFQ